MRGFAFLDVQGFLAQLDRPVGTTDVFELVCQPAPSLRIKLTPLEILIFKLVCFEVEKIDTGLTESGK